MVDAASICQTSQPPYCNIEWRWHSVWKCTQVTEIDASHQILAVSWPRLGGHLMCANIWWALAQPVAPVKGDMHAWFCAANMHQLTGYSPNMQTAINGIDMTLKPLLWHMFSHIVMLLTTHASLVVLAWLTADGKWAQLDTLHTLWLLMTCMTIGNKQSWTVMFADGLLQVCRHSFGASCT